MMICRIYLTIAVSVEFQGFYDTGISCGNLKIRTRPDEQPIARLKDPVDNEKAVGRYSDGNHRRFSPL